MNGDPLRTHACHLLLEEVAQLRLLVLFHIVKVRLIKDNSAVFFNVPGVVFRRGALVPVVVCAQELRDLACCPEGNGRDAFLVDDAGEGLIERVNHDVVGVEVGVVEDEVLGVFWEDLGKILRSKAMRWFTRDLTASGSNCSATLSPESESESSLSANGVD